MPYLISSKSTGDSYFYCVIRPISFMNELQFEKISTLAQLGVTYVRRVFYFQGYGSIIYLKTKKQETCQKASPSDALDIRHNKCSNPITYRKQPVFKKWKSYVKYSFCAGRKTP